MTTSPAPRPTATNPDSGEDATLRAALRRALEDEPASEDESARLEAAQHRWMHDWAAQTGQLPAVPDAVVPRPVDETCARRPLAAAHPQQPARGRVNWAGMGAWLGAAGARPASLWLGGAGVAAALCAGVLIWQHHQNEVLIDELSQVDVLSQMAAGDL